MKSSVFVGMNLVFFFMFLCTCMLAALSKSFIDILYLWVLTKINDFIVFFILEKNKTQKLFIEDSMIMNCAMCICKFM